MVTNYDAASGKPPSGMSFQERHRLFFCYGARILNDSKLS